MLAAAVACQAARCSRRRSLFGWSFARNRATFLFQSTRSARGRRFNDVSELERDQDGMQSLGELVALAESGIDPDRKKLTKRVAQLQ
eukprot:1344961-Prymnesium_polylepis.1